MIECGLCGSTKDVQPYDEHLDVCADCLTPEPERTYIEKPCPRCEGRGYHHGFGEDGHDPDWCTLCGGPGVLVEEVYTEEEIISAD